ncbi:MAG: glycosyltransferase [Symploca sp. SIO2G7]|nr:glycosyltransferase [Symploca sp. SIO2G7]
MENEQAIGTTKERLIVFTRYPEPGKTKTRMMPILGAEGAAMLQRKLTENTLLRVKELAAYRPLSIEVHFTGGTEQQMQAWLGSDWSYQPQVEGDLGERMASAFATSFAAGITRVVTIGIDCPDLKASLLEQAFETLKIYDLVLGPAEDGGYYLIGLKRMIGELFVGISWGTSQVRQQTVEIANQLNLKTAFLPLLKDIDRPEDLSGELRIEN